ncbi:hypothetical protein GLOTRDRAFT_118447 [Gloeophyllum trabeum ATCC 11539]|uniref:DUF6534 domain-containing protein n=1 Tax=Gloeophyllum trabeum (strain ATCC 11539 / FP-39264 / Madison 617) TaxID=670483 RepID=S7S2K7_GLOTA|nr:uncharacterized protein GLOTRDRAFT_118447 [Gloeophyllum trabeum ATCC 11539]EPQ59984.1 hypothetical protein GLOTRDRAFT_118447 [Gloeophyllum trabeum ATCC 11539]
MSGPAAIVAQRLGPLLLGGLIALGLSGIVNMQAFIYLRTFKNDYGRIRAAVGLVWFLDLLHSALVCATDWTYLIVSWGDDSVLDRIPMACALTILTTAMVTFVVQCFFTRRVLVLSKNNWVVSFPMFGLAFLRLVSATATTALMIKSGTFSAFRESYQWVFTLGLVTSVVVDVLVTLSLCHYLQTSRTGFSDMDQVIDTIMLYTINNGSLTCVSTIVSLICWLVMPTNLVYLGFHFAISKLYANSFLATLNTRDTLRERSQHSSERGHPLPIIFPSRMNGTNRFTMNNNDINPLETTATKLQINVEKTIHCEVDGEIDIGEHRSGVSSPSSPRG